MGKIRNPLDIQNLSERQKTKKEGLTPLWLVKVSESDYMAMRLLFFMGAGTFVPPQIMHLGAECLEKIMKVYLQSKMKITPAELRGDYKDNLEKIRIRCSEGDGFFNNDALQRFCQDYSIKLMNEVLRYGLDGRNGSYILAPSEMVQMVDQFFLQIFIKLDINSLLETSYIASIFNKIFLTKIQETNLIPYPKILLMQTAIQQDNLYLNNFLKKADEIAIEEDLKKDPKDK